jgi:hypothetical protein
MTVNPIKQISFFGPASFTSAPQSTGNTSGAAAQPVSGQTPIFQNASLNDIQVAYLGEIPSAVNTRVEAAEDPDSVSPGDLSAEVEANKIYLIMLGAVRSFEYLMALRNIQFSVGYNDDTGRGWPRARKRWLTLPEAIDMAKSKGVVMPGYIEAGIRAKYAEIQGRVSADKKLAATYNRRPWLYWNALYDHFAWEVASKYVEAIFGDGTSPAYDVFGRLTALNGKLAEGNRLDLLKICFKIGGAAATKIDLSNFNPRGMFEALKVLSGKRESLSEEERAVLDEMIVISTLITFKYLIDLAKVQYCAGFRDDGSRWPKEGRGRRAPERAWETIVSGAAEVIEAVKKNMLFLKENSLITNSAKGGRQIGWYNGTYDYYAGYAAKLYALLTTTPDGSHVDPLTKIADVNNTDLCGVIPGLDPANFNELAFLDNVRGMDPTECLRQKIAEKAEEVKAKRKKSEPLKVDLSAEIIRKRRERSADYIISVFKVGFEIDLTAKRADIIKLMENKQITEDDIYEFTMKVEEACGRLRVNYSDYNTGEEVYHTKNLPTGKIDQKRFSQDALVQRLYLAGIVVKGKGRERAGRGLEPRKVEKLF